jgi:cell division septum initiation protein DivIVA
MLQNKRDMEQNAKDLENKVKKLDVRVDSMDSIIEATFKEMKEKMYGSLVTLTTS